MSWAFAGGDYHMLGDVGWLVWCPLQPCSTGQDPRLERYAPQGLVAAMCDGFGTPLHAPVGGANAQALAPSVP